MHTTTAYRTICLASSSSVIMRKSQPYPRASSSTLALLVMLILLVGLWNNSSTLKVYNNNNNNAGQRADDRTLYHEHYNNYAKSRQLVDRCHDADDPPDWQQDPLVACMCPNPWQPQPRMNDTAWDVHHQRLVEYVQYAEQRARQDDNPIDLVLIGDSITERWNGTASLGRFSEPANRAVFEKYFGKGNNNNRDQNTMNDTLISTSNSSAPLHGIALGSARDIAVETHWHILNGMLPEADAARPTVYLLLIGTNDLSRQNCSKNTTLAGILAVAQEIRRQRPHSPIVLHGLLPRTDTPNSSPPWPLYRYWQDILWINRELQHFAERDPNWYYFGAAKIFLRNNSSAEAVSGAMEINVDLMSDGLHPNAAGLDLWGPLIVEHVQNILASSARVPL